MQFNGRLKRTPPVCPKLPCVFAPEIVEDGAEGVVGPFEASLVRFYNGQVIPFAAG